LEDCNTCDAVKATVSHPFFKLRWLSLTELEHKETAVQELFEAAVRQSVTCLPSSQLEASSQDDDAEEVLFGFVGSTNSRSPSSSQSDPKAEMLRYLGDPRTSLSMLHDYPAIRGTFIRYNTPLASSAPVERLFSFANLILRPNRTCMSDNLFEALVILRKSTET